MKLEISDLFSMANTRQRLGQVGGVVISGHDDDNLRLHFRLRSILPPITFSVLVLKATLGLDWRAKSMNDMDIFCYLDAGTSAILN
ncbi:hypothetical protein F0562_005209 [Nyssa sinensis]|uniref:Uncharacterized protein n=1 Tax=Nyssa sinensis TaxID=561372 RepID=A0A5J5AIS0_9ASTE|nr:hypothetical protein F0562_005209 [Nyssa sinensis]